VTVLTPVYPTLLYSVQSYLILPESTQSTLPYPSLLISILSHLTIPQVIFSFPTCNALPQPTLFYLTMCLIPNPSQTQYTTLSNLTLTTLLNDFLPYHTIHYPPYPISPYPLKSLPPSLPYPNLCYPSLLHIALPSLPL